jgi:flagellar hook assembly protein FlgD
MDFSTGASPNSCHRTGKIHLQNNTFTHPLQDGVHRTDTMIYDMNGREVYRLLGVLQKAGRYEVEWEEIDFRGERVASGIYYYKIEALKSAKFSKMTIVR